MEISDFGVGEPFWQQDDGRTVRDYEKTESRIGMTIRHHRISQRMSQDVLAEHMQSRGFNTHQTTIGKIENGSRSVRISELLALADCLGVSWSSLVAGQLDPDVEIEDEADLRRRLQEVAESQSRAEEAMLKTMRMYADQYAYFTARARYYSDALAQASKDAPGSAVEGVERITGPQRRGGVARPIYDDGAS
ncbi:helix-turn-helix domain-containing protein [Rathayibacter sp. AY1A7]|jgi:transcriptional regulator with XRE-family HTH domain|uniref:helix-turn-helix domain-containing protein n=1 Tax=Rathayibacter sp. AY1A7 TaxID=2080524 RepID=UPI0015E41DEB|nr:helix-turn-helix transcriptional regulator [Rathayibacter sp. AY1A7]